MPPAPTAIQGVGGAQSTPPTAQQTALAFDQASHRGVETSNTFTGIQQGTSAVTIGNGPIGLKPQGYLRGVVLDLATTTAATGTPTANADYPFCLLNLLRLHDTNGATMQEVNGFGNYLINLFGGYKGRSDLSLWPDYSASATSPSVQWYLPVELDPNGFGALANQSSADEYKLDLVLDTLGNCYSTAPTAGAVFTLTVFTEFWTLPGAQDMLGRPQQQEPPFHGVAQYVYQSTGNSVNNGQDLLKIGFTGNMYRQLIIVGRSSGTGYATGGPRNATTLPNPYTLRYDTRDLMIGTLRERRFHMDEMLDDSSGQSSFLTGVMAFLWDYGRSRKVGGSGFMSWLPTLPATRFELTGTFGGGTVDYFANTVSVAETNPILRGVSPSQTGYAPPVAPTVPA
jgi:hypothetical protein